MYELYDPCTVMFFFRNKHIMIDLGTGNNNKIKLGDGFEARVYRHCGVRVQRRQTRERFSGFAEGLFDEI